MSPDTVPPPDIDAAARALGHAELHPRQRDSIDAVVSGRDVLALLASGFGKSAIYQVAASLLDGPTVVLSPLIALQRDQVDGLRRRSTHVRAVAVHSEQSDTENERSWESLARGEATIVYLTPEAASRNEVQDRLRALGVACVAVDEAHCIAAWGHDFRPAYLRLGHVAEAIGRPPIIAVTATAPPPIRDEITTRLGMLDPLTVVGSFDRPEIRLSVVRHHDADVALRAAVDDVVRRSESGGRSESNGQAGTGLVYTATRAQAEEFAALLAERGLRALAYHAGLPRSARDEAHEAFAAGTVDVVAATSAFGMGIDKPDVRFVVHTAPPDSLERYYQEFGRAGRDGADAAAVLHFRAEDLGLPSFFATRRPRRDALEAVQGRCGPPRNRCRPSHSRGCPTCHRALWRPPWSCSITSTPCTTRTPGGCPAASRRPRPSSAHWRRLAGRRRRRDRGWRWCGPTPRHGDADDRCSSSTSAR